MKQSKKILFVTLMVVLILFVVINKSISEDAEKSIDENKTKTMTLTIDHELYSYIERNEEFIKTNEIKSIKVSNSYSDRIEFYNHDGELTKIEYPNIGIVDIFKIDEKKYYRVIDFQFEENEPYIHEMNTKFFIDKDWPHRQSIATTKIILIGRIELIYTEFYDTRFAEYYIYNEDGNVAKILKYSYSYDYDSPYERPKDFKLKFKNKNIIPELTEIIKYDYDSNGKLISVEIEDIKENKTAINYLQYNERGLVSKDENEQIIEYEHYE